MITFILIKESKNYGGIGCGLAIFLILVFDVIAGICFFPGFIAYYFTPPILWLVFLVLMIMLSVSFILLRYGISFKNMFLTYAIIFSVLFLLHNWLSANSPLRTDFFLLSGDNSADSFYRTICFPIHIVTSVLSGEILALITTGIPMLCENISIMKKVARK